MNISSNIRTLGLVGGGVIGSGWAARALAHGLDVVASDPAPGGAAALRAALERLGLAPGADRTRLRFVGSIAEVVAAADFIQENALEREELKRRLLAETDAGCGPDVIIASSSSGLLPSRIQADCRHPERVVIGHPFNPVYLLPLVEIVPGERTASSVVERAAVFYRSIGMRPLRMRKEIEGYLSDRLQEALWREALHLVNEGLATTEDIDDAIVYGPGLRYAFMGTCLTFHLAGGEGGMAHMLDQFGPALKLPWTKLVAPELTRELRDRMVEGTAVQADGRSIKELERWRDDCLIRLIEALAPMRHERQAEPADPVTA
jgi:carnitine 3-dehydrogenase